MEKMNAVSVTYEMISSIHVTAVPGEVGRLELELYWPSLPHLCPLSTQQWTLWGTAARSVEYLPT